MEELSSDKEFIHEEVIKVVEDVIYLSRLFIIVLELKKMILHKVMPGTIKKKLLIGQIISLTIL